jgi:hypothetical protein
MKHNLFTWHYRFGKAGEDNPTSTKHFLIKPHKTKGWLCVLYIPKNIGRGRWLLVHYISIGNPTSSPKLISTDRHNLILKCWEDWPNQNWAPSN